jgi:hypothetical protein
MLDMMIEYNDQSENRISAEVAGKENVASANLSVVAKGRMKGRNRIKNTPE